MRQTREGAATREQAICEQTIRVSARWHRAPLNLEARATAEAPIVPLLIGRLLCAVLWPAPRLRLRLGTSALVERAAEARSIVRAARSLRIVGRQRRTAGWMQWVRTTRRRDARAEAMAR